ncbi:phosphotransferase [Nocardia asteroides]|uniref:DUF7064 domain-containing protein n=1 Tax=Nocardia asteroides TaxID=1824 RepID=UPI0033CF0E79
MDSPSVVRTIDDLTSAWLDAALGCHIHGFTAEPVGTGQASSTYRVTLDSDGDLGSVVLKLADPDPAVRRTGMVTGHYEREIRFYRDIAHRLPTQTLPQCYAAVYDSADGYFTLLVEDASPARTGDQLEGCTVEQARIVVVELARLVAAVAEEPELAWVDTPWPVNRTLLSMMLPTYYQRFGTRVTEDQRAVIAAFAAAFDTWAGDRTEPRSIVHNDFRLDNMLFGEPGAARELTIVDWATLKWGPITSDLAFFLGGNLSPEDRRKHETELVTIFHSELVANGLAEFTFDDCWRGYRWAAFYGILMAVVAPLMVTQSDRGDQLFLAMLERHCQQVRDLDSVGLLSQAHDVALRVARADEERHLPGRERYWNESFYLDAIDASGKIGAYVRIGFVPNLGHTVYTAYIVGEGRPSVALVDYQAPLPYAGFGVTTDKFTSDLIIEDPLKRVRATFFGIGESFVDPADALRGKPGAPVDVAMDLVWETEGRPYMYQITTRFEMPCHVTGTVRIGEEVLTIDGPGQRDHSWGDRNWWSMDWTWVSAHLDDGTRMQAVELRVPGLPIAAVGYEQNGKVLTEISSTAAAYDIPAERLPGRTRVVLEPTGFELEWQPIAYAPLRMASPDGRVCEFPRAMARVRTADGRTGLGWLEWGHNVEEPTASGSLIRSGRSAVERFVSGTLSRIPEEVFDRTMQSGLGRHVVAAAFAVLPRMIDPRRADIANAVVRFKINTGPSGNAEIYDLMLSLTAPPRVQKRTGAETSVDPRVTLTLDGTDFVLLGLGRLDPVAAALERRIIIDGDLQFMAVVSTLLAGDGFPAQQPLAAS